MPPSMTWVARDGCALKRTWVISSAALSSDPRQACMRELPPGVTMLAHAARGVRASVDVDAVAIGPRRDLGRPSRRRTQLVWPWKHARTRAVEPEGQRWSGLAPYRRRRSAAASLPLEHAFCFGGEEVGGGGRCR